jgi:hypothetical protein
MDSDQIIACLGKLEPATEVQQLLRALGVVKKLRMPKDDIEARADLPELGLSLIFKPSSPKSSVLFFQAVQFFSDMEDGYKNFAGALPNQLQLTDTQTEVRSKLGRPTETKAAFRLDRWMSPDRITTIEYAKKSGRISAVTVHVPAPG